MDALYRNGRHSLILLGHFLLGNAAIAPQRRHFTLHRQEILQARIEDVADVFLRLDSSHIRYADPRLCR